MAGIATLTERMERDAAELWGGRHCRTDDRRGYRRDRTAGNGWPPTFRSLICWQFRSMAYTPTPQKSAPAIFTKPVSSDALGIPAMALMTTHVVSAAELMARVLGYSSYEFAVIPHPISSATDDALRGMAATASAQVCYCSPDGAVRS